MGYDSGTVAAEICFVGDKNMLLKSKDDIGPQLSELNGLLRRKLSTTQRSAIEKEKAILQAGSRAEKGAAFEIDFRLKDHKEWVVILSKSGHIRWTSRSICGKVLHDRRVEWIDMVSVIAHSPLRERPNRVNGSAK